jgi:hypothetical protein
MRFSLKTITKIAKLKSLKGHNREDQKSEILNKK